jgi:hypothetical protein
MGCFSYIATHFAFFVSIVMSSKSCSIDQKSTSNNNHVQSTVYAALFVGTLSPPWESLEFPLGELFFYSVVENKT